MYQCQSNTGQIGSAENVENRKNRPRKESNLDGEKIAVIGEHANKALKRWRHRIWRNVLGIEELDEQPEEVEVNFPRYRPETLQQLCKLTKFSRKELQLMYRGFKEEFVLGLSVLSRGTEDEKLRWVFNLYDVDNDGYLTRHDIETVLVSIYDMMGQNTDPPVAPDTVKNHVDAIFQKMDDNSDGLITFPEFLHNCKRDLNIRESLHLFDTVFVNSTPCSISPSISSRYNS
uniref:EF-hand domain-containing protein n=1 Tax=Romanomermis culicivorax TaxID=13658 RepID=A0A915HGU1_ROMCU